MGFKALNQAGDGNLPKIIKGFDSTFVSYVCHEDHAVNMDSRSKFFKRGCRQCYTVAKYKKEIFKIYGYSIHLNSVVDNKLNLSCLQHGGFSIFKNSALKGSGCKKCRKPLSTFSRENHIKISKDRHMGKCYLYVLRVFNDTESFFKIGVTVHKNIKKRYPTVAHMPYSYEVLSMVILDVEECLDLEALIKLKSAPNKYMPKIKFNGCYTECFKQLLIPDRLKTIVKTTN